ncbi:MAG TPA: SpoIIIAH-like family protein [Haloplasmataceae bacterium]
MMKPQSKITIFMVVMIVMLSIYYFTLGGDDNKNNNPGGPNNQPTFRYEPYEKLRTELQNSRKAMMEELNALLVSADLTEQEKNETFNYIVELQAMSTRELNFEEILRNEGYLDAFVQSSSRFEKSPIVVIRVLDTEHSVAEAASIMLKASEHFISASGLPYEVTVEFDTIDPNEMY